MPEERNYTWAPQQVVPLKPLTVHECLIFSSKILTFGLFTLAALVLLIIINTLSLSPVKLYIFKIWENFGLFFCENFHW